MKKNTYVYMLILSILLLAAEADNYAVLVATKILAVAMGCYATKKGVWQ